MVFYDTYCKRSKKKEKSKHALSIFRGIFGEMGFMMVHNSPSLHLNRLTASEVIAVFTPAC